ncbi:MAG: cob(I)yrinic acid a,c-diamide adenosyltransferase [Rhodospirillaceae bacterium]
MVKLNKIYTRTGDEGETGIGDGSRLPKHALRVSAYGDVDEANAVIGIALSELNKSSSNPKIAATLLRIQNDLFDLGADLCVPEQDGEEPGTCLRITQAQIEALETDIDDLNESLSPLTSFVLPSGTVSAAHLHHARTVVRRTERMMTALAAEEHVNTAAMKYINRLSDLLFVMARVVNLAEGGDILWRPGGER